MALSGKYNFSGIKRLGAAGLRGAMATTPMFAWMLKFGRLNDLFLEFLANFLANKGLVILNIPAIVVDGHIDQHVLDREMDKAISEIENKGGREALTEKQKKAIDDEVLKAARKFVIIGKP